MISLKCKKYHSQYPPLLALQGEKIINDKWMLMPLNLIVNVSPR